LLSFYNALLFSPSLPNALLKLKRYDGYKIVEIAMSTNSVEIDMADIRVRTSISTETSSDCIFLSLGHCLFRYFQRALIIAGKSRI